jgi:hypothetical protein
MRSIIVQAWERLRSWWGARTESQRDQWRIAVVVLVLIPVGAAVYRFGRPVLHRWQRDQALDEARELAAKKDYRAALVALHRAVAKSPPDVQTWKQVADFLGEIGSPEVLVARKNLVWLAPDDLSLRLGFVLDALRFGDVAGAREAVSGVREGAREEVDFFRMAAALAYATGRTEEFERSLTELLARAPADREAALDLATLRLWGADAGRAEAARASLTELLAYPDVRVRAAVELLKHVARTGTRADANALVAELHRRWFGQPPPPLAETAQRALTEPPGWVPVVEAMKRDAEEAAHEAAVLARWLAAIGQPREAALWLDGLADRVRRSRLVGAARLELALGLDDAERLRPLLLDGAWGRARSDTIDLAFAARWQRRAGRAANAAATWADAVASAGESLPGLRVLARVATAWGDAEGAEAAMQAVTRRFPAERWAWEALRIAYSRRQDTLKLHALYDRWVASPLATRTIEQDWVYLAALAGQTSAAVHARAQALRDASPFDPVAVLGHALSLRAQKRTLEAFVAIDGLVGAERETQRARLWRGILLHELGRKAEARQTLGGVETARLLPEELRAGQEAFAQTAPAKAAPEKP